MKDPAVLFYPDKWFLATKEMKPDCRGWYLNLILHQFDKKDLPNDIEELAVLADVRISEFERFKQVFEQVLKQKFKQNENGRLENSFASEILMRREMFLEKRTTSGKLGYFLKFARKQRKIDKKFEEFIKENYDVNTDLKDEQVLKQVLEHLFKLYINVNEIVLANVTEFKNVFSEIYLLKIGSAFYWDVKEMSSLKQLKNKISYSIKSTGKEATEEMMLNSFKYIIKNVKNKWVLDHFKPSIINYSYNDIINELKNGKGTNQFSDSELREILSARPDNY